jgi:hypothetical protein
MIRLFGTVLLASSLSFGGGALAWTYHNYRDVQPTPCFRGPIAYSPGAYCVSGRGMVEVCMRDGSWISIGACIGAECRAVC